MRRFQYRKQSHNPPKFIFSACLFLLILLLFIQGISSLSESTAKRQRESLEKAIMRSITYCYSVEVAYPESLEDVYKRQGKCGAPCIPSGYSAAFPGNNIS